MNRDNEENYADSEVENKEQQADSTNTATPPTPGVETNTNPQSDPANAVRTVRNLLGQDVVLIPVVKGDKKPAISDWQKVTIASMSDPVYLRQLEGMNIGVVLGTPSNGLCAIDIDDDDEVEPFLALNPALRQTLRTRGARGAQIWVRVKGDYQKLTKVKTADGEDWGEWRADGGQSVIYGQHPSGVDYSILHRAKPIEIQFRDIKWPANLVLPWVKTDFQSIVEREGEPFSMTKTGVMLNQMFFVRKYTLEHHVLFDASLGDFFQYDPADGLWKKQSESTIKRVFLDDLATVANESGLAAVHLKRTNDFVGGLVALLRATVEQRNAFANRLPAIHVANGMICFTGDEVELRTYHPSFLSRNRCPFKFDPTAECKRFKTELLAALNPDDISLMQRWAGSVMLGHNAAQRFMMLLGTAGGGKSTVMTVLERTIGFENVAQMRTEHLSDKFELYGFAGKTLLTGKDVSADFLMHKGAHVLKALVGHDLLEAEKKGANERVQLVGDFNVGITCNSDLNIRLQGDAGAWRRRLMVIKYDAPPPTKRVVDFADQLLAAEGAGILRWMIEGAMDLLDDLAAVGDYRLTDAQKAQIDRLMDQSDSVRRFVKEGIVLRKTSDVAASDLLVAYYEFCEVHGWQPFPMNELRAQLPKHMLEIHKSNCRHDIVRADKSVRGYKHVAIVGGGMA